MAIAYLVNQHPRFSQSFIRREILALEAAGIPIQRFSIRSGDADVVDPADQREAAITRVVLKGGIGGMLRLGLAVARTAVSHPIGLWQGLKLAIESGKRSDRGLPVHLIYWAEACVLLHWFRAAQIHHVHVHFGTNSTLVAMLCRAMGGPGYSFTVHGPEEFDRMVGIALGEKIRRSAFVVGISSFGRSQLYRWCEAEHWPKIHIVHCGVDQQYLKPANYPIDAAPNLVCVGRLCEQKGQLLLVEAARELARSGLPFQLTLVGDGPLRAPLEQRIAEYGLTQQVIITGVATGAQVQQHLLHSRAFVLPSFGEGLPVAIMEALALQRPVISTYIAGIPELVRPGVNGWLVPAGSVSDLAAAMREALTAPVEQLEAMGQAGALAVAQHHDITQEAQKLARLFPADPVPARISTAVLSSPPSF
jgi:colanic acid/amylovoran biosynthesis glycosyltransferase